MPRNPSPDPILSMSGRKGAHIAHARNDSRDMTAKARAAFYASFEALVDPDGVLSTEERARRAEHLRRAHYAEMALRSAIARRKRAARRPRIR